MKNTDLNIGPYFWINNKLIFNKCSLSEGRKQFDKIDNSYAHEKLYDDYFKVDDYIDYPRGRVVWDMTKNEAVIYIDRCINKHDILTKIIEVFNLRKYRVEYDEHYRCKNCMDWSVEDEF